MTEVVTEALRERLKHLRHERGAALSDRLLQIGKDCAAHSKANREPLLFKGEDFLQTDVAPVGK